MEAAVRNAWLSAKALASVNSMIQASRALKGEPGAAPLAVALEEFTSRACQGQFRVNGGDRGHHVHGGG